jgi:hypothetical protein
VTIGTRSLSLKDRTVPPTPASRRVSFKADTRNDSFSHRVLPPAPGGSADPTLHGATVTVYNSNPALGHPTDSVTVTLNAADWKVIGKTIIYGFKYTGPDPNGPLSSVTIKNDRLSIRGGKTNWGYTLDEPAQGRVGVRFSFGDGTGWCTDAPAKSATTDRQDRFVAALRTPAPASCPPRP